jgi:DnaJ-class molecular chaperone
MRDGHEMLFFEEGEPIIDGEPGDLKMKIKTAADDTFRRDGNDLYMTYHIDLVAGLVTHSRVSEGWRFSPRYCCASKHVQSMTASMVHV